MVRGPKHDVGVALFKRLKRFGGAVFDGKTQSVSEYHGKVDLTIEFDGGFIPKIVADGGVNGIMGDDDFDSENEDGSDDGDAQAENIEGSADSNQLSFFSKPMQESHTAAEIVTVLPTTNTTVRRLPEGFRPKEANARSHAHKRKRNGMNTKSLGGGGSKPKTKLETKRRKADPAPAPAPAIEIEAEEAQVAEVAVAVDELIHEGSMVDAPPDTSVCWLCRKWLSLPAAREGHVCETDRQAHAGLLTHGVLFAAHYMTSRNREVNATWHPKGI